MITGIQFVQRDEWVEGHKNRYTNFINATNNRLESINQKLKAVVSRHSSLLEFNEQLQSCLSSLRAERNHRAASIFQKRPVCFNNFKEHELQYYKKCTPFAFKHIQEQLTLHGKCGKTLGNGSNGVFTIKSKRGNLQVCCEKCHCDFFTSMKLPCRHILALRKHPNCPLFCKSLCDKRWTKDHYFASHRIFKSCEQPSLCEVDELAEDHDSPSITVGRCKEKKVLSQHEKYRKAFEVTRTLASLASEASGKLFQTRLATLQHILELWKDGKEVAINNESDDDYTGQRSYHGNEKSEHSKEYNPILHEDAGEKIVKGKDWSNQLDEKLPQKKKSQEEKSHLDETHSNYLIIKS